MGLSRAATWLRCCDPHLCVSGGATCCCDTCIYARVCMWVGQEMMGGAFLPCSQTAPSDSHIFPCGHGGAFKCPPTDTSASHQRGGTTKAPQCGAQWVCDGGFLWLGKEWEWNHHLMTLSPNQEGLVVFSERPVGCRCAGPVTSLPQ